MEATLVLGVLTVLVASNNAAVIKASSPRAGLNVGEIGFGDRLLHRQFLERPALEDIRQFEDVVYRGDVTDSVTAVMVTEVGGTHDARAWIALGGLGRNRVTVRIRSAVGKGYQYLVDIWGRTDAPEEEELTEPLEETDAEVPLGATDAEVTEPLQATDVEATEQFGASTAKVTQRQFDALDEKFGKHSVQK